MRGLALASALGRVQVPVLVPVLALVQVPVLALVQEPVLVWRSR